ncbi:MAG: hypothetical protein M0P59_13370 [Gallionella sp.]|jgi:hypothetical protein|nr:hypothetical protein [Gallionella sp.]
MPSIDNNIPRFAKQKELSAEWETFRKGLNLLLRPTELGRDEYAQGDNIMLIGSGVPTGRWGTLSDFTVNSTGSIRGFATYNNIASLTNELLALSDQGYIVKKDGTGSTVITGQSYPSGSIIRGEQLGGNTYLVSKNRPLTYYDGTSLHVLATIAPPTGGSATNISGVSGTYVWSWAITTLGPAGGETTPLRINLPNLPQDLTTTRINVQWSAPSAATLAGYQIYRGLPGDETFLSAVGASTTIYVDTGSPAAQTLLPPISNGTGGIQSEFIGKDPVNDRLVMVDKDDSTKLSISGRYPNHSKFDWASGGGSVYVGPDDGFPITGYQVQPGSSKITVFKSIGSYAVELQTVAVGNFVILDPQVAPISTSVGCTSVDTIQVMENDVAYFGRQGMYVVGYEPNFLNIIRTNEISAKMRPYLELLGASDYANCCAMYVNHKYLLSFPDRKEILVYDRERGCFAGIWKMPFGVTHMKKWIDATGTEKWELGTAESNQVYTFETSVNSDDGATITKTLKTNKESFNTWSILKILNLFYVLFRNITGEVTINILSEDRSGVVTTVQTFSITGTAISGKSGWGANLWGSRIWGATKGAPVSGSDEFTRWGQLYKESRLVQIEISCTAAASNFEFLGARITANSQGEGSLSSAQRVT